MPYSEFADTFAGSPYVQDYIDRTSDGNLISAYFPIYDSAGEIVGILGCDYEASYVVDRMGAAVRSTLQISALLFVLAIVILNLIAGKAAEESAASSSTAKKVQEIYTKAETDRTDAE